MRHQEDRQHEGKKPFRKYDVSVKETARTAEIADKFGNLRYKVMLTSFDVTDDDCYDQCYQVQVISYFGFPEPLVIAERPDDSEGEIYDFREATRLYRDYVKSYASLVDAETRDHQDIDVYKDSIDYKKTVPECCATCKWCARKQLNKQASIMSHDLPEPEKLVCTNPLCNKDFEEDVIRAHEPHRQCIEDGHGRHLCPDDYAHDAICPDVSPFGVCARYEKGSEPYQFAFKSKGCCCNKSSSTYSYDTLTELDDLDGGGAFE